MNVHLRGANRTRWAAFGAAIAVSIGGGSIAISQAAISSGDRGVYTPIAPCRVFDTRSGGATVGPRSTPIGAGEVHTQQITGANGNCTTPIPADATAVALNVTAVDGNAASFLTIWPSDVTPRPVVSSLNWVPGSPPTPNKVDTKVSPSGQINLYNDAGTVNILADIVGYYSDHNHDDRYYPRGEVYNKAETYNRTETYNMAETYSRAETDEQFTTKAEVATAPYSHLMAGGYVLAGGALIGDSSFGNIETSRISAGLYSITLLGYRPGCAGPGSPFLTATLAGGPFGFVVMNGGVSTTCDSGDTTVYVETADTTGSPIDHQFTFAVYSDG